MPNAIQQIQYQDASASPITPDGGLYDLVFSSQTTTDISFSANNADIGSALNNLAAISGDADVEGTVPTFTCEFIGALGNLSQPLITAVNNSLTLSQNTVSVSTFTPGTTASQASFILDPGGATIGVYSIFDGIMSESSASTVPITGGVDPILVQGSFNGAYGVDSLTVTSFDGTTPDKWLVVENGTPGQTAFPGGYPSINSNSTDGTPGFIAVTNGSPSISQVDAISLAGASPTVNTVVTSGTWTIGTDSGIAYNDNGTDVISAIESNLSISGGSIANPKVGYWQYTYGTPGDQSANTSLLASECSGDTLTQPVSVNIITTQVGGGTATKLIVAAATSTLTAGAVSSLGITAEDSGNNVITSYTGPITLTDSLSGATFGGITFSSGIATVAATYTHSGAQSVTATDNTNTISGTSAAITVSAAAASKLIISASTTAVTAGQTAGVTVTAEDQYSNVKTNYSDSVTLSDALSGNGYSVNPITSFTSGVGSSAVTLIQAGTHHITALDSTATITGTAPGITVSAATAILFAFFASPPSTVTAGVGFAVTIDASDSHGNTVPSFTGNVTLAIQTNPGASTLGGTTVVAASSGVATFTGMTLNNAGVGYKLRASGSLTAATSGAFTVKTVPVSTGGSGLSGLSGLSGESGMISI